MTKIVVFTDLDGTLLDEETYAADNSLQALRSLQGSNISVIFCSSKTRKEQEVIRNTLGVQDPFIVENGSAVFVPPNTVSIAEWHSEEVDHTKVIAFGMPIEEIRATLNQVVVDTGITYQSFLDLSSEQVAQITGLDVQSAKLAKAREFSETIVTNFNPSELEMFAQACNAYGLQCTLGGRFLSITRKGADKGRAVLALSERYRSQFGDIITIGVGDSPNDAPMLRAVDAPYLVQRPNSQWRQLDVVNLHYIPAIGPLGFTAMVKDLRLCYPRLFSE